MKLQIMEPFGTDIFNGMEFAFERESIGMENLDDYCCFLSICTLTWFACTIRGSVDYYPHGLAIISIMLIGDD